MFYVHCLRKGSRNWDTDIMSDVRISLKFEPVNKIRLKINHYLWTPKYMLWRSNFLLWCESVS